MTLSNKKAGMITTRVTNEANISFVDGVLLVSGNLENVNAILNDLIFVPNKNFAENFNIWISIKNEKYSIEGKI